MGLLSAGRPCGQPGVVVMLRLPPQRGTVGSQASREDSAPAQVTEGDVVAERGSAGRHRPPPGARAGAATAAPGTGLRAPPPPPPSAFAASSIRRHSLLHPPPQPPPPLESRCGRRRRRDPRASWGGDPTAAAFPSAARRRLRPHEARGHRSRARSPWTSGSAASGHRAGVASPGLGRSLLAVGRKGEGPRTDAGGRPWESAPERSGRRGEFWLQESASRVLCLKNIRTFLSTCCEKFSLKSSEVFEAFDLFDVQDFGKVMYTLSALSWTPIVQNKGIMPFPTDDSTVGDEDIYSGLSGQIDDTTEEDDDLYDCMENEEAEGDEIYEDLMRSESVPTPPKTTEYDKRCCCLREIQQTEEKYTDTLGSIHQHFMKPLQRFLKPQDMETIFVNIEELVSVHTHFLRELKDALAAPGATMLYQVFIKYKEREDVADQTLKVTAVPEQEHWAGFFTE